MSTENMFEKATRLKLRFNHKGVCTVEDLWDLNLQALDKIYKDLNAQLREHKEESLLNEKSKDYDLLDLKINIVKYIVEVRLHEQKEKENEAARKEKKQKILKIIEEKQEENLKNKSIEELNDLVNDL